MAATVTNLNGTQYKPETSSESTAAALMDLMDMDAQERGKVFMDAVISPLAPQGQIDRSKSND
jgi:hypothetical protein